MTLSVAVGAEPPESTTIEEIVERTGTPARIDVEPVDIVLKGPHQYQQLLATGHYSDGSVRDLTRLATFATPNPKVAQVSPKGIVTAVGDGTVDLVVRVGSQERKFTVRVSNFANPEPVNFKNEVLAAMTRMRCNSGAGCHGTPTGKNGFRLSLQGYLPDDDYWLLTREMFGRRVNPLNPNDSLILKKGLGLVSHGGGKRMYKTDQTYQVLHRWIAEGCKPTPQQAPELTRLEVLPSKRALRNDARRQQLVVLAHFSDGSRRDVTPLVYFTTSDEQTASVAANGLVTFHKRGSVAVMCRFRVAVDNARLSYVRDVPGFVWTNPPETNYIDKLVFAKLRELQIAPSDLCDDDEFIRRLYLDVLGVLPSITQVQEFLADKGPEKRARAIDKTLDRPEYADFWAMKWADVLRNTRKNVAYRGAHNYRRFLVQVFAKSVPFDRFVADLLTSSGDTMINPAANFFRIARDPQDSAETTAQLFLGVRMQCAKCHNHPFERWTQDDYYGFAAFFARVKHKKPDPKSEQEVVYVSRAGEVNHQRTGQVVAPKAPNAPPAQVGPNEDRREQLAHWLTNPKNPFFAKSVVNRLWFHLLGRGIVDPVDDFRDSNPPCNEELLDALAAEFVASGFNVKQILRTILNSRVYQLSAKTNQFNADDERYFSRCYPKLLTAEQLLDAICTATMVPEKFPGLPLGTRATQLPDAEINHAFLQAFGQPTRELACECGRESESTLNQALNLINGDLIHAKLRDPGNRIGRLLQAGKSNEAIVNELYLATLSRPAEPAEIAIAVKHVHAGPDRRRALEDVHWALLNCKEFLFRH
jgi:hypothetical protein